MHQPLGKPVCSQRAERDRWVWRKEESARISTPTEAPSPTPSESSRFSSLGIHNSPCILFLKGPSLTQGSMCGLLSLAAEASRPSSCPMHGGSWALSSPTSPTSQLALSWPGCQDITEWILGEVARCLVLSGWVCPLGKPLPLSGTQFPTLEYKKADRKISKSPSFSPSLQGLFVANHGELRGKLLSFKLKKKYQASFSLCSISCFYKPFISRKWK